MARNTHRVMPNGEVMRRMVAGPAPDRSNGWILDMTGADGA